jgi:NADP-dependent 3-hydroxy acid dehydrogenase YdfG
MKTADLFDIQGHVALVTGAASGLGLRRGASAK